MIIIEPYQRLYTILTILEDGAKNTREIQERMGDLDNQIVYNTLNHYIGREYVIRQYSTVQKRYIYRIARPKGYDMLEKLKNMDEGIKELKMDLSKRPYNKFDQIKIVNNGLEIDTKEDKNGIIIKSL